jgi:hypothetical protein
MKFVFGSLAVLVVLAMFAAYSSNNVASPVPARVDAATVTAAPAAPPNPADSWDVARKVNDLDKATSVTLTKGDVVLRCAPASQGFITPALNNLGGMLDVELDEDGNRGQTVRYKFDNGPVQRGRWQISTDFEALFMPRSVLQQLAHAKSFTVEYKPEYVIPTTQTFDVEGLGAAESRAGCRV